MSKLSINPVSSFARGIAQDIRAQIAAAEASQIKVGNQQEKIKLDAKIDKLSAGYTSGYNQAVAAGATFNDQINTGMGNVANVVQSPVGSGAINSLTSSIGSFGTAVGNAAEGILGAAANTGKEIGGLLSKLTGGNLAGGASNFASVISSAAGELNDFLSLKRGANLPKEGELFTSTGEGIKVVPQNGNDWRLRISCAWDIFKPNPLFERLIATDGVVFPVLPNVNFSTKANYTSLEPIHNNYPFQAYKNSQIDEIGISGTFLAENADQAAYWIASVTFFKTMTKMFFGRGAEAGSPPPICNLNGYGASVFDNVPVVIKSFQIDLSDDVDYIKCDAYGTTTWVPITSDISIQVQPVYNRRNLRQFSLTDYARGQLKTPSDKGYL